MMVITGAGIVSAIGHNKAQVLDALRAGRSGIRPIRYLDTVHRHLPVGEVQLSNEEMAGLLGVECTESTSRTTLLGALALREAVQEAGLQADQLPQTALVSGTTVGNMDRAERLFPCEDACQALGDCGRVTREMAAIVGAFGFTTTCSTACSSAANAFILGANLLRSGLYQRVIVGGSECLSRFHFNGFRTLMILDDRPCRPFDATRAGLNLGEGAAFMVLETAESAAQRGATPLAVLSGWGNACDAFHQTASSEDGQGAFLSMTQALKRAGLAPADIDYVNAHGTGTLNNDASESAALHRVFGQSLPLVSSTKSMTGHTTSASGGIEMVICLLAMQHRLVPKNLNWAQPMPDGVQPVTETLTDRPLRHVLCNSFGFGGNDTSLLLSAYSGADNKETPPALRPVYVKSIVKYADIAPDEQPRIPPMVARRLSGVLKRALATSLFTLQKMGVEQPDAIITGTEMGCLHETESFLKEMCLEGETCLKPTHFIQSTHNTISSLVAIRTHTHGYNSTWSHGSDSFFSALLDAWLQLQLGDIENALVGLHDERGECALSLFLDTQLKGALLPLRRLDDLEKTVALFTENIQR